MSDLVERLRNAGTNTRICCEAADEIESLRVALAAEPSREPVANEWFALVMCAAAELEDAANCLRDQDAKRVAERGASYYRAAAKRLAAPAALAAEPSKCDPTQTECPRCRNDLSRCDGVFAAPAAPVVDIEMVREQVRMELLNTPELANFIEGVQLESQHQRQRWGSDHDSGKSPADWFWLVGYLAGKALSAHSSGNTEKALHHTITTAAALAHWHASIAAPTPSQTATPAPAAVPESLTDEMRIDYLCEASQFTCGQWQVVIDSDNPSFLEAFDEEAKRAHGIAAVPGKGE